MSDHRDTPDSLTKPESDGLDEHGRQIDDIPRRGPAGDARPNDEAPDPRTRGGQPPEGVEDRPSVSTVTPEDYPEADRVDSRPD